MVNPAGSRYFPLAVALVVVALVITEFVLSMGPSPGFPVQLYEDRGGNVSPEAVFQAPFRSVSGSHFSLGYSRSVWWIRWTIDNPTPLPTDRILHFSDGFMIEHLDYFEVSGAQVCTHLVGGNNELWAKDLPDSGADFRTELLPGDRRTVYLRLQSENPLMVSMVVYDLPTFIRSRVSSNVFLALVLGAMLSLAIYNLFLFFSLGGLEYLLYVVHIASAAVYVGAQSGFATELLGINGDVRTQLFYTGYLISIALLSFGRIVLETKKRWPAIDRAILMVIGVNVVGTVVSLIFGLKNTLFIQSPLILVDAIFLLFVGLGAMAKRAPTALYFNLASGTFLLGASTTILLFLGLLPYTSFTRNSYFLGIVLEAVLMSLLLSHRIQILRYEKLEAQAQVLLTEQKAKQELEAKITERTQELEKARNLAELQAGTDALTGLSNRRAFFEQGTAEVARSNRYQRSLTLVMLDLDHFKLFNDHYGHAAGDQILMSLAETIRDCTRSCDLVGRLGGEEFALLLPETPLDQGVELAERLRQKIASTPVRAGGNALSVTASLGVAGLTPTDLSLDALLARADGALYQAKEQRNTVAVR